MKALVFIVACTLVSLCTNYLRAQEKFIPASVEISQNTDTLNGRIYILHTVSKGQTLYSIRKAYQCKEEDIFREFPKQPLSIGEVLRIRASALEKTNISLSSDSLSIDSNTALVPSLQPEVQEKTDLFKIVLMLPFFLEDTDSISCKANSLYRERAYRYLSFYQGFKMAMDSAKEIAYSLHVYDVNDDTIALHRLLENEDIRTANLIIAASFVKPTQIIDNFSRKYKIPFIHPLTEREVKTHNPYYIQASPSMTTQIEEWATFLYQKKDTNTRFIIVSDSNTYSNAHLYAKQFYEIGIKKSISPLTIVYAGEKTFPKLESQLSKKKKNMLVGFYDKPLNYSKLLYALQSVSTSVILAGMPQWVEFNKNESKYLNRLKFAYFSPFFVDYQAAETEIFEQEFYQIYYALPDKLAYKGYDLANFIQTAIYTYNTEFITNLDKIEYQGLAYDFIFIRRYNAYENKAIRKIKLDKWEYKTF